MNPDIPQPDLLRDLYPIAIEEYRFAVQQNSDRQKFFVGINLAVSSVVPSLSFGGEDLAHVLTSGALFLAAVTAALGIFVINKSHAYYRNARSHFQRIEKELGLHAQSLGLATTAGMTSLGKDASKLRVYRAVQALLFLLLAFDLVAVWITWKGG